MATRAENGPGTRAWALGSGPKLLFFNHTSPWMLVDLLDACRPVECLFTCWMAIWTCIKRTSYPCLHSPYSILWVTHVGMVHTHTSTHTGPSNGTQTGQKRTTCCKTYVALQRCQSIQEQTKNSQSTKKSAPKQGKLHNIQP